MREIGIFIDNKDEPAAFCISENVLEGCLESRICRLHPIGLIVPENRSTQSPEIFGSAGLACLEESDIWLAGSKPAEKRRLPHASAPIHDHHLECSGGIGFFKHGELLAPSDEHGLSFHGLFYSSIHD